MNLLYCTSVLGSCLKNSLSVGRDKDLIIIRGRNHYPQDIEKTVEGEEETRIRGGCSAAFSVLRGSTRMALLEDVKRRFSLLWQKREIHRSIKTMLNFRCV